MPDPTPTTTSTTTAANPATAQSGLVVDKNKTNEQYIKEAEAKYIVPKLVRETFPDLIKLIYETESMDQEEREYWLQIMPIMSEEQIKKFRDILVNEKDQLKKLDEQYKSDIANVSKKPATPEINEEEMKKRLSDIAQAEKADQSKEEKAEADILSQLDKL